MTLMGSLLRAVCGLALIGFARHAGAAAGDLDPSFGGDGIVTTAIGSSAGAAAVVLQPDGKLVAAGYATVSTPGFALARYLADGSLDPSFGSAGTVMTPVGFSSFARALVLQADGKLIAVGYTTDGSTDAFALVRYEADGSLDAGYGTGGIVTTAVGATAQAYGAALQADGTLVVAGSGGSTTNADFALARYDTDGALDPTFSSGGIVTTPTGTGVDRAYAVAIQADGAIVAAGSTSAMGSGGSDVALARYTSSGALDPTFGAGGITTTHFGTASTFARAYALLVQPDQHLVIAGTALDPGQGILMVRYLPNGSLDPSFGIGGMFYPAPSATSFAGLTSLVYQSPGRIVLGGGVAQVVSIHPFTTSANATVARMLDDASVFDLSRSTDLGTSSDYFSALVLQPDAKLVGVGGNGNTFALARYDATICGDNVIAGDEQCDDGNFIDGDGCDRNCTPTGCGNGIISPGENCEDGNTLDGDCCSSTCVRDPSGVPCTDDSNGCTDDVCNAGGFCTHPVNTLPCDDSDGCTINDVCNAGQCVTTPVVCSLCERCDPATSTCVEGPRAPCTPVLGASARLQVADKAYDKSDALVWKRLKANDTPVSTFGDPIATHDYALCLYDESGPTPVLRTRALTRRGTCGNASCWKASGTRGFRYRDKLRMPAGVDAVVLKGQVTGPSTIIVKGRGALLDLPTLPLPLPARVQLQATNGACWEATYSAAGVQRNDATMFKGVDD